MTDFATDLFWEEPREKAPLEPGAPVLGAQQTRGAAARRATAESHGERLQRVAGNAALSRDVAARAMPAQAASTKPHKQPAAPEPAARKAKAAAPRQVSEPARAAAARAEALDQVLASFADDPARAALLALAQLLEAAPPDIALRAAAALANAVMRATPSRRRAIDARIEAQLGDQRHLVLARLLADRLGWLPPPAPPPAPEPAPAPPAPTG